MNDLFAVLDEKKIKLPENITKLLKECKSLTVFNTTNELAVASTNGIENKELPFGEFQRNTRSVAAVAQ